jgi:hypothetical protein
VGGVDRVFSKLSLGEFFLKNVDLVLPFLLDFFKTDHADFVGLEFLVSLSQLFDGLFALGLVVVHKQPGFTKFEF